MLINQPKFSDGDVAEAFRKAMVALGARWNNTYVGWNLDESKAAAANALVANIPPQRDLLAEANDRLVHGYIPRIGYK